MDLVEFVNTVIPTVGGPCADECGEDADHLCLDDVARCVTDCWCAAFEARDVCGGTAMWP
jgi:hypothetical protein